MAAQQEQVRASFTYLIRSNVSNLDKYVHLLHSRGEVELRDYLREEVLLTTLQVVSVMSLLGPEISRKNVGELNREDIMLMYYAIAKVLKKAMPMPDDTPPVMGGSKKRNTLAALKCCYKEAKEFVQFLENKMGYFKL